MPDKVVDASVVAAFAFDEVRASEAGRLMASSTLYAPTLLPYELCSAARRKTLVHPDREAEIATALATALAINISLLTVPAIELLGLALEAELTPYDAAYLWLSRQLRCDLLTFDTRLARAAASA